MEIAKWNVCDGFQLNFIVQKWISARARDDGRLLALAHPPNQWESPRAGNWKYELHEPWERRLCASTRLRTYYADINLRRRERLFIDSSTLCQELIAQVHTRCVPSLLICLRSPRAINLVPFHAHTPANHCVVHYVTLPLDTHKKRSPFILVGVTSVRGFFRSVFH